MRIIDSKVNWFKGYGNLPELEIVADSIPHPEDLAYQSLAVQVEAGKATTTLYWACYGNYVSFFAHVPANERGYGGRTFHLSLVNGGKVAVKGPWSSSAIVMNQHFKASTAACIIERKTGARYAGHILMNKAIALLSKMEYDFAFVSNYSESSEVTDPETIDILLTQVRHDIMQIGHYDIVPKYRGLSLKQSQVEKNKERNHEV